MTEAASTSSRVGSTSQYCIDFQESHDQPHKYFQQIDFFTISHPVQHYTKQHLELSFAVLRNLTPRVSHPPTSPDIVRLMHEKPESSRITSHPIQTTLQCSTAGKEFMALELVARWSIEPVGLLTTMPRVRLSLDLTLRHYGGPSSCKASPERDLTTTHPSSLWLKASHFCSLPQSFAPGENYGVRSIITRFHTPDGKVMRKFPRKTAAQLAAYDWVKGERPPRHEEDEGGGLWKVCLVRHPSYQSEQALDANVNVASQISYARTQLPR